MDRIARNATKTLYTDYVDSYIDSADSLFSTGFTLFSVFFFLYPSPSCIVFSYTVFNAISSVLVEVILINPFANVFFFGGFSIHRKDCLTYSCEADRPGELSYSDPWLLLTQSSSFGFYWSCCFSFQWLFVIAFNCPFAEWEGVCDHLRDFPWEDIFTLDASDVLVNFRSGSRFWFMYISLTVNVMSCLTHFCCFQLLVLTVYSI